MHIIRTDFGFNLLCSASKLKRGVIEGTGGLFLVFRDRGFFFPNILTKYNVISIGDHIYPLKFHQINFSLLVKQLLIL
jgi:hypothetical protein